MRTVGPLTGLAWSQRPEQHAVGPAAPSHPESSHSLSRSVLWAVLRIGDYQSIRHRPRFDLDCNATHMMQLPLTGRLGLPYHLPVQQRDLMVGRPVPTGAAAPATTTTQLQSKPLTHRRRRLRKNYGKNRLLARSHKTDV